VTKLYEVSVREIRHYDVKYLVAADSVSEAHDKAESGDTLRELDESLDCIWDRHVGVPKEIRQ
jgi:hypothetical protein